MNTQTSAKASGRRTSNLLIPLVAGIVNSVIFLSTGIVAAVGEGLVPIVFIFLPFGFAFLGASYGVWRLSRIGYIALALTGALLLLVITLGPGVLGILGAPTAAIPFFSVLISVPAALVCVVYSIFGFRDLRRGTGTPVIRMIPASTMLALLAVGFIVGGGFIGVLAAGTESRLLANSGGGDITIVRGASNPNNAQFFSPSNFTVKAGTTVTWLNQDSTGHTVTSFGSNLFDSGDLPLGATFSYTFTQPGTYQYYCTIHPWMKGTIVVTSG